MLAVMKYFNPLLNALPTKHGLHFSLSVNENMTGHIDQFLWMHLKREYFPPPLSGKYNCRHLFHLSLIKIHQCMHNGEVKRLLEKAPDELSLLSLNKLVP